MIGRRTLHSCPCQGKIYLVSSKEQGAAGVGNHPPLLRTSNDDTHTYIHTQPSVRNLHLSTDIWGPDAGQYRYVGVRLIVWSSWVVCWLMGVSFLMCDQWVDACVDWGETCRLLRLSPSSFVHHTRANHIRPERWEGAMDGGLPKGVPQGAYIVSEATINQCSSLVCMHRWWRLLF